MKSANAAEDRQTKQVCTDSCASRSLFRKKNEVAKGKYKKGSNMPAAVQLAIGEGFHNCIGDGLSCFNITIACRNSTSQVERMLQWTPHSFIASIYMQVAINLEALFKNRKLAQAQICTVVRENRSFIPFNV